MTSNPKVDVTFPYERRDVRSGEEDTIAPLIRNQWLRGEESIHTVQFGDSVPGTRLAGCVF